MSQIAGRRSQRRKHLGRKATRRHWIESLEDRRLLATYTVDTTADAGPGSLRQAIIDANADPGPDAITFELDGSGPHKITLLDQSLPRITDPLEIDATAMNGYSGAPLIELSGENGGGNIRVGFSFHAGSDGSTVKGFAINRFDQAPFSAIDIFVDGVTIEQNYIGLNTSGQAVGTNKGVFVSGNDNLIKDNLVSATAGLGLQLEGNGNRIEGNKFGTNIDGTSGFANGSNSILIQSGYANHVIDNLVSGSRFAAVAIRDADNTVIQGNRIGTTADGTQTLSNSSHGILVERATGTMIGGSAPGEGNLVSGNGDEGIRIENSAGTVVRGNIVGTDVDGMSALGNIDHGVVAVFSEGTVIGGPNPGDRNLVSGNGDNGIATFEVDAPIIEGNYVGTNVSGTLAIGNGSSAVWLGETSGGQITGNLLSGSVGFNGLVLQQNSSRNHVDGNLIGTDVTGTLSLGNNTNGILIRSGASENMIGGATEAERNIISGNRFDGIRIQGATTQANHVGGNYIGVDRTGLAPLGNGLSGVHLFDGANHNVIGLNDFNSRDDAPIEPDLVNRSAEGNVISGNGQQGVQIQSAGTDSNIVAGNFIGTDAFGLVAIGNQHNGVLIDNGAQENQIGTDDDRESDEFERNLISGNFQSGILITGESTSDNEVRRNWIGLDQNGGLSVGNADAGISLQADGNVVGGGRSSRGFTGNFIAGNGGSGIQIPNSHVGSLEINEFQENAGLAIDVGSDGQNLNDLDDNVVDFPIIETAELRGNQLFFEGWAPLDTASIMLYLADTTDSPFAEGYRWLEVFSGTHGIGGIPFPIQEYGPTVEVDGQEIAVATEGISGRRFSYETTIDIFSGPISVGDRLIARSAPGSGPPTSEFGPAITIGGPFLVTNTNDSGQGSLRHAIEAANDQKGPNEIAFEIPGEGPHTIEPDSPLPAITDPVIIDGTTDSDFVDQPIIVLRGANIGEDTSGLILAEGSSGSEIRGLVINQFDQAGVLIESDDNLVAGNYIGIDATGELASPNRYGIHMTGGAKRNRVGGASHEDRNVISGNENHGIWIFESDYNQISGNFIGTNAKGDSAVLLSDNSRQWYGIYITLGSFSTIGSMSGESSAVTMEGNLISGSLHGIRADGGTNTAIAGNTIGLNAAGDASLGSLNGISLSGGSQTTVVGNVISGHRIHGILVIESAESVISANFIGTNHVGLPLGNDAAGISVYPLRSGVRDLTIGGTTVETQNVIAFNSNFGIENRIDAARTQTTLLRNSIHSNGELAISIDDEGRSSNLGGERDFPIIESAALSGQELTIRGFVHEGSSVDIYVSDPSSGLEAGQGVTYFGTFAEGSNDDLDDSTGSYGPDVNGVTVSAGAVDENRFEFRLPVLGLVEPGTLVTLVRNGVDAADGTSLGISEFSPAVAAGISTVVTNTNDSGPGSLRQAILHANELDGTNEITFDIPGPGPHRIEPEFPIPAITDPIIIDGTTEPDFVDSPLIELSGASVGEDVNGLHLDDGSNGSTIRGLVINHFDESGVLIHSNDNHIAGNYLGTNWAGNEAASNSIGIRIEEDAQGNLIGGATNADRNLISANRLYGIEIISGDSNRVSGNYIGTNARGDLPVTVFVTEFGNQLQALGITVRDVAHTVIGAQSTDPQNLATEGNLISGNHVGIDLRGEETEVTGNLIGVTADAYGVIGNSIYGVSVHAGSSHISENTIGGSGSDAFTVVTSADTVVENNYIGINREGVNIGNERHGFQLLSNDDTIFGLTIGGERPETRNVIANNGGDAIWIRSERAGRQTTLRHNSIFDNAGLGISTDYVAPDERHINLGGEFDFPIIESAFLVGNQLTIRGFAHEGSSMDLYISDPATGPEAGQGKAYLATVVEGSLADSDQTIGTYGPDVNGVTVADAGVTENRFEFQFTVPAEVTNGTTLTLVRNGLAADPHVQRVSEFSPVVEVLTDVDAPTSQINSNLPAMADSPMIPLSWTMSDLAGPFVTGVTSVEVQYSVDDKLTEESVWHTWRRFDPEITSATFPAESNRKYWFRTLATDRSGNVEAKLGSDARIFVGDFQAPETNITQAVVSGDGASIDLTITGSDVAGGIIESFDIYVFIDFETAEMIASVSAGEADEFGTYTTSFSYFGEADGVEHEYLFFSIGVDDSGNVEETPDLASHTVRHEFPDPNPEVVGFDVQRGQQQRSFIDTLDVSFNTFDEAYLDDLIESQRFRLEKFAVDSAVDEVMRGTGETIDLSQIDYEILNGSKIRLNLGGAIHGVGSTRNGFYRLSVDTDRNGQFDDVAADRTFYRVWGDVNGDGQITDEGDRGGFLSSGSWWSDPNNDISGDGKVTHGDYYHVVSMVNLKLGRIRLSDEHPTAAAYDRALGELDNALRLLADD
ncbi:MAG: right-handed parallel beta-helix repeat-containing protein [Planctomycetota bacterium]